MLVIISNSLLDAELYDSRGCVLSGVSVLLNLIETDRRFRKNVCIKKSKWKNPRSLAYLISSKQTGSKEK